MKVLDPGCRTSNRHRACIATCRSLISAGAVPMPRNPKAEISGPVYMYTISHQPSERAHAITIMHAREHVCNASVLFDDKEIINLEIVFNKIVSISKANNNSCPIMDVPYATAAIPCNEICSLSTFLNIFPEGLLGILSTNRTSHLLTLYPVKRFRR